MRVQWNYGMVALVVAIAIGFAIDGPWWGALVVMASFPLAWLRARILAGSPSGKETPEP